MYFSQILKTFTVQDFIDQIIINNFLYQIPRSSSYGKILEINLDTNEYNEYQISNHSYSSVVYVEDIQSIFLIPLTSSYICEFNLINKEINYYSISQNGFSSGVYHNGKIIMVPITGNVIGVFDIFTKSFTTIGNYSSISGFKWGKQIKVGNFLYAPPLNQSSILKINLDTLEISNIGTLSGSDKWCQQQYFPKNNRIYFLPQQSTQFLELNPENDSYQLFGNVTISQSFGYGGGYGIIDNLLYILPVSMNNIIILHPFDKSYTFIPLSSISVNVDNFIYSSNNLTYNNQLYLVPRNTKDLYQYDFTFNNKIESNNNIVLTNYQENFTIPVNFVVQDTSDIFIPLNTSWISESNIVYNKLNIGNFLGNIVRNRCKNNFHIGIFNNRKISLLNNIFSRRKNYKYLTTFQIGKVENINTFYSIYTTFNTINKKQNTYTMKFSLNNITNKTIDYGLKLSIDYNIRIKRLKINYMSNIGKFQKNNLGILISNLQNLRIINSVFLNLIELINLISQSTIGVYFSSSSFLIVRSKINSLLKNQKNIKNNVSSQFSLKNQLNKSLLINNSISKFTKNNINFETQVSISFIDLISFDIKNIKNKFNNINLQYNIKSEIYKNLMQINQIGILSDKYKILLQQILDTQYFFINKITQIQSLIKNSLSNINTNVNVGKKLYLEYLTNIENGLKLISKFYTILNNLQYSSLQISSNINTILHNIKQLKSIISVGTKENKVVNLISNNVNYNHYIKSIFLDSYTQKILLTSNNLSIINNLYIKQLKSIISVGTKENKVVNLISNNVNYNHYIKSIFLDSYTQKILLTSNNLSIINNLYKNITTQVFNGVYQYLFIKSEISISISYKSLIQFYIQTVLLKLSHNKINQTIELINNNVHKLLSMSNNSGIFSIYLLNDFIKNIYFNINDISILTNFIKDDILNLQLNTEIGLKNLNDNVLQLSIALNKNINFSNIKLSFQDKINNMFSFIYNLIESIKDYLYTNISVNNYEKSTEKFISMINIDYISQISETLLQIIDISQDKVKRFFINLSENTGFKHLINLNNLVFINKTYIYNVSLLTIINELVNLVSHISIYINYRKLLTQKLSFVYNIQKLISNNYQIETMNTFYSYNHLQKQLNTGNSLYTVNSLNINTGININYSFLSEIEVGIKNLKYSSLITLLKSENNYLLNTLIINGIKDNNLFNQLLSLGTGYLNYNTIILNTLQKVQKQSNNIINIGYSNKRYYDIVSNIGIKQNYIFQNEFQIIKTLLNIFNNLISTGNFILEYIQSNILVGNSLSNILNSILQIGYYINYFNNSNISIGIYSNILLDNDFVIQKYLKYLYNSVINIGYSNQLLNNINYDIGTEKLSNYSNILKLEKYIIQLLNLFTINDFLTLIIQKYGLNIEQIYKNSSKYSNLINNVHYNYDIINNIISNLNYKHNNLQIITDLQYSMLNNFINSNLQVSFNKNINYSSIKLQFGDLEISDYSIISNIGILREQLNNTLYSLLRNNKITLTNIISIMYYKLLYFTSISEIIQYIQKNISQINNIQIDEYIYPSIKILFNENILDIIKSSKDGVLFPPSPYVYPFDEENPYDESYFSKK